MIRAWDRENEATLRGRSRSLPQLCFVGQESIDALGVSAYQVSGHKTVSLQGVTSELTLSVAQTRQQKLSSMKAACVQGGA